MTALRDLLRARAFHEDAGPAYNQTSYAVRTGDPEQRISFYEIVLEEGRDWDWLRDTVVPNLVRHLDWKRYDPAVGDGLVVTVFAGDRFYLVHAPDFLALYREEESLDDAAFRARVAHWLGREPPRATSAGGAAPLALPAAPRREEPDDDR